MKIEKIKNFNQVILAIVGVLSIILLIVFIIVSLIESGIFDRRNYRTVNSNSLISDEKAETLNQESLRKQIVSYQSPLLLDTLNAIYIIPVSVTTLNKAEETEFALEEEVFGLLDTHRSFEKGYYQKQYFEGQYTNLIVYQPVANKTILLFNERIMLNEMQAYYFKDDILLVFYTSEKDTNKDGLIDLRDDRNLCIYSLKSGKMRKITDSINSVKNYQFIENSRDLLIEFSLNQYKDVKFNSYDKPSKVMKYEFETEKLSEIVPAEIQQQMQKLIQHI
ncbi:MAG: hypothetical protein LBU22_14285 [Dysgonamonadaceae bacterium]|jgi:hypothetical protein|nr:hypothetical protein [Dysgonamonadaceae bacterium]